MCGVVKTTLPLPQPTGREDIRTQGCGILRLGVVAADLLEPTYEELADMLQEDLGLAGVWNVDGIRTADLPNRRMSMGCCGETSCASTLTALWSALRRNTSRVCTPVPQTGALGVIP